jgi:hypothetical protein
MGADDAVNAPRLLFVPVSGAQGAGEYFRSLTLARAAQRRWPQASISFILNREAGYAARTPFATELIDGSPTHDSAAVNGVLARLRPHVVIFDSAGRRAQLACARGAGARTVYISSRPSARWKGFRLRRMRELDQHWLVWPTALEGGLSSWERLKLKLAPGVRIVHLDVIFPEPDSIRAQATCGSLGVTPGAYTLFCAGGGGHASEGRPAPDAFALAAAEVARAHGGRVLWIRGPNYSGTVTSLPGVKVVDAVAAEQMVDLLSEARLGVLNGGSLLLQALALGLPTVVAPVAGDQRQRIAACAARGVVRASDLDVAALATASLGLLGDATGYDSLKRRVAALGLRNGVDTALDALASLLGVAEAA